MMDTSSHSTASARLSGPHLWLARLGWAGGMLLYLGLFIYAIPTYRLYLHLRATQEWGSLLQQAGLTEAGYIALQLGLQIALVVVYTLAALFLVWRRSDSGFTLAVSLMMVAFAIYISYLSPSLAGNIQPASISIDLSNALQTKNVLLGWLIDLGYAGAFAGLLLMVCLLPDGRWQPRWTLPLSVLWSVWIILGLFFPRVAFYNQDYRFFSLAQIVFFSLAVLAQGWRYFRLSPPVQRQQTKWLFLGILLIFIGYLFFILPQMLIPGLRGNNWAALQWHLWSTPLFFTLPRIFFPFFMIFAMLRYRLWDVDFVLNRSLVYGALTLLLAAMLGLSLYLISALAKNFTGGPLLAVAVSAAVFGAVFQPARRALQRFVDQRFYQIAIDYGKTPPPALKAAEAQNFTFTHLGDYADLTLIGRGGMAEVYRATHPKLNKTVAIKLLPASLVEQEDYRRRFAREARLIAQLEHPHIVRLFDFDAIEGAHYMVMEYLNGPSLSAWQKERGALPLAEALPILRQIASALDYAHSQGIVHRDIKPSNVLLEQAGTPNVRAVLTDFGVAKLLGGHTALTKTGMLGTFDYIAPEQIRAAADVDGRADIYSMGIMAYQMLTGQRPFEHDNPGALLLAHLNQPAPDPRKITPELPSAVAHAIEQAMAKQPEERFNTASEFVAALAG